MFGLVLAGFSLGFALSPIIAIFCSHFTSSLISVSLLILSFTYTLLFLPETLTDQQAADARLQHDEYRLQESESLLRYVIRGICRPFKELSILNRNEVFRLLSVLAFFSGMSNSGDGTLLLYYIEGRLDFTDADVAILFGLMGIIGIFVQSIILKQITEIMGERLVIVFAFICGAITDTMFSFANTKELIFIAIIISSFTGMSFPTISAIKSNIAEQSEQGRIQGALYALSSLARALGPAVLSATYQKTKNTNLPGSFFLVSTFFYFIAVCCACVLPKEKTNSTRRNEQHLYNEVETNEIS